MSWIEERDHSKSNEPGKINVPGNQPFLLRPATKDYLWGGTRLNNDFGFNIDINPFAEAWVCSTHPDGESTTADGITLSRVIEEHRDWLGTHPLEITGGKAELPILFKLIDAKKDLSVQVHPDDEYARRYENGSWGKTEMWYVLAAKPGAQLIYGFNRDVNAEQVRDSVNNGSIGNLLNTVEVHKNDLFYIESGMVHAISAGCLIAEIQQSSNLTYRLYDYDRVDKNGKKRDLHIDKALAVAKLSSSTAPRQPMRVLKYTNGCASELLTRCKYFQVERLLLNTEGRKLAEFKTAENSFHVLLCVDGCGNISWRNRESVDGDDSCNGMNEAAGVLNFFKGDCVFVPANSVLMCLHGQAQILNVSC